MIAYLEADSPEAAGRFGRQLKARIVKWGETPHLGVASRGRKAIRYLVHHPYLIFYRVDSEAETIEALRIWHGARNPRSFHL